MKFEIGGKCLLPCAVAHTISYERKKSGFRSTAAIKIELVDGKRIPIERIFQFVSPVPSKLYRTNSI